MKTNLLAYDTYEDFRKNPKKLESLIKMYPKSERPLVEKAAELMLGMRFSHAEFDAHRTMKMANALNELQTRFSKTHQKEDPALFIDVGLTGKQGSDPFPYIASYGQVSLALPQFVVLSKDAGRVNFTFPHGLPVGTYGIWVYWYPVSGQQECKIRCVSWANPCSSIKPLQPVDKNTVPDTGGLLPNGIDMIWDVVAPNEHASLCIKNNSGEYLACLGTCLLGVY